MASRLVRREAFDVVSLDYRPRLIRAETVLSGAARKVAAICCGQVLREKLGIVAAFCGANFNDHRLFHLTLL